MRAFPYVVIAALLCWLAPASAWAQLDCSPCSHSFGRVQIGTSSSYSIKLTNNGTREVRITSRSIQTPAFSLSDFSLPVTIMPGASVQLEILFTPSAKGYAGSNITLANTSPNSHLALHFGGNGLYPDDVELQMTPPKLVFGNVTVGSNTTLPATLTALNGAITITSDQSNSSEFAIVGLSLPAGQIGLPVAVKITGETLIGYWDRRPRPSVASPVRAAPHRGYQNFAKQQIFKKLAEFAFRDDLCHFISP